MGIIAFENIKDKQGLDDLVLDGRIVERLLINYGKRLARSDAAAGLLSLVYFAFVLPLFFADTVRLAARVKISVKFQSP